MVVLVELVWEVCGWSTTFWVAAALQSIAWAGQVGVGHWLVEKNQPGMATSLTLASVVLSPLMVWYEVLWMLGLGLCMRDEVHLRLADTTVKDN